MIPAEIQAEWNAAILEAQDWDDHAWVVIDKRGHAWLFIVEAGVLYMGQASQRFDIPPSKDP